MPQIDPANPSLKSLKGRHLWHAPMSSCSQRVRIVLNETGQDYDSHLVNLEKDEHATPEYQAIHPKGLVPAYVNDGKLFIESVDIIQQIAGPKSELLSAADPQLLEMADEAQTDLKLLTFEFLFRFAGPAPQDKSDAFQAAHQNDVLKQFKLDFAKGFERERIDAAVNRTAAGFQHLNDLLADGRMFLSGNRFSLSDIAWMPNFHRFQLMEWPFERTPNLQAWFGRVAARDSYQVGLVDWQPAPLRAEFAKYVAKRRDEGTDIAQFGVLAAG
ncbi:MAG: glutathione S-transferase family protein [Rhizobiaceae bacterium]